MKNKHRHNPFLMTFLFYALIFCLAISFIFLYIFYKSEKKIQQANFQEKIDMILEDFSLQMERLDQISLHLSINNRYSYSFLTDLKYNEIVLLDDFQSYQNFSAFSKDLFLYYDHEPDNIFHVSGNKANIDLYLGFLSEENATVLKENLAILTDHRNILTFSEEFCVITPFYTSDTPRGNQAVLGSVISYNDLEKRFNLVAGKLRGSLALYFKGNLLYSNHENACTAATKNVLTSVTEDGDFLICYLPLDNFYSRNSVLLLSLFAINALLIMSLAHVFAHRAYEPILGIKNKYKGREGLLDSTQRQNVFDEIENLIDYTLEENALANIQILKKQELLKQQILRLLLNGAYTLDIQSHFSQLGITLPGPFYYVVSIDFSAEPDTDILHIQTELGQIVTTNDSEHIYVVSNNTAKQLWAICSLVDRNNEAEMTECITSVVQCYAQAPTIGIGKLYVGLSRVSVSWLESLDQLTQTKQEGKSFSYHFSNLQWLENALVTGDQQAALNALDAYAQYLQKSNLSLLMQQYIFTEFIGEISRLSKDNEIKLSTQKVNLLISSKNIEAFHEAAAELICEYCENFHLLMQSKNSEQVVQILGYIKDHFTEYSLSIEKVATELHMTNTFVREAIQQSTGMKYKDYLLHLRIEYAKELLLKENMSVADTCTEVGYVSVSYFISAFKEIVGVTPARYVKDRTKVK